MKYTRTGYINNLYGFLFHLKGDPRPSPQDFRVYKEDRWGLAGRMCPIGSTNNQWEDAPLIEVSRYPGFTNYSVRKVGLPDQGRRHSLH